MSGDAWAAATTALLRGSVLQVEISDERRGGGVLAWSRRARLRSGAGVQRRRDQVDTAALGGGRDQVQPPGLRRRWIETRTAEQVFFFFSANEYGIRVVTATRTRRCASGLLLQDVVCSLPYWARESSPGNSSHKTRAGLLGV